MCLSVSAADDSEDTGVQIYDVMQMSPQMYWQTDDETVSSSYTSTMQMRTYSKGQNGVPVDMVGFSNTNSDYYNSGRQKMVVLTDYLTISPDTQYSLNFAHTLNFNARYTIDVYVVAYGNGVKRIPIFSETYMGGNWSAPNYSDFSFKINSADLGTSYKCRLYIEHSILSQYGYGSDGSSVYQLIQREIKIVDDDVGWLVKILNAIRDIPSKIGGFFETLKQSISGWFEEQKQKIQDFSDSVGQWFDELGDKISGYFTDLYNDLIEGLKSLFIPSEGYFDAYMENTKTWAAERFGFLYTAADLMSTMVTDLQGLLKDDFSFVLPAANFTLNGTTYTLWEAYTLPMGELLQNNYMKYAYGLYKTLLGSLCAFALFKYAQHVFDKVMAN